MSLLVPSLLQNYLGLLRINLNYIFSTTDCLSFHLKIQESIEILSYLKQFVRNKQNTFGTRVPNVILAQIISFLSSHCFYGLQSICKSWNLSLNSSLVQQTIMNPLKDKMILPTYGIFRSSWTLSHKPTSLSIRKNILYISSSIQSFVETRNIQGKLLHELEMRERIYGSAANFNYICFEFEFDQDNKMNKIIVLDNDNKILSEFEISFEPDGLAIDNECIYISSNDKLRIFSIVNGVQQDSWDIKANTRHLSRKLAVYQQKIFMVDHLSGSVFIFSKQGKTLGKFGTFHKPWGITITNNVIYIVDTGNKRIQAFTHDGSFLFIITHPDFNDILDVCVYNNLLFVSDWEGCRIFSFYLEH